MDAVIEASAAVLQNESHLSPSVLCTVFIYPPGVWVKQEPGETLNTNTHTKQTGVSFQSHQIHPEKSRLVFQDTGWRMRFRGENLTPMV